MWVHYHTKAGIVLKKYKRRTGRKLTTKWRGFIYDFIRAMTFLFEQKCEKRYTPEQLIKTLLLKALIDAVQSLKESGKPCNIEAIVDEPKFRVSFPILDDFFFK